MSQWFGGQGRKGGKTTPEDSSEFSRGRAGRPVRQGNEPQVSRPGASRPQSTRPQPTRQQPTLPQAGRSQQDRSQPTRPQQDRSQQNLQPPDSSQGWNPNLARGASNDVYSDNRANNQNYQQYQQFQDIDQPYAEYETEATAVYNGNDEFEVQQETAEQIEFKKRLVGLIIDFLAFYLVACAVMLIPFLNAYLSVNLVLCLLLLFRDVLFEGRGIGKNLMGLQVIDAQTGGELTLKQAALRNIVLFGPYLAIQLIGLILHFIPIAMVNQVVMTIVNAAGALYVVIVFPIEVHRAYTRPDGRRLGDELAQTEVIDSSMDFSQPFPTVIRW